MCFLRQHPQPNRGLLPPIGELLGRLLVAAPPLLPTSVLLRGHPSEENLPVSANIKAAVVWEGGAEWGEPPPFLLFRQLKFRAHTAVERRGPWGQMWREEGAVLFLTAAELD